MESEIRTGLPWEPWETNVLARCRTVTEASRKLMRDPSEVRRKPLRKPFKCFYCRYWDNGLCGIEKAGLRAMGKPLDGLKRHKITDECHLLRW